MNERNLPLSANLRELRGHSRLTLEQVAERVGVTRQAVAKWESGESVPDVANCTALAQLYGVTLDDLVRHDREAAGIGVPPKGKHMFGLVTVGERGQIVIPKQAREIFGIRKGDKLLMIGDETRGNRGLALVDPRVFFASAEEMERAQRWTEERRR